MAQTLEELKAANAAAEAEVTTEEETTIPEQVVEDEVDTDDSEVEGDEDDILGECESEEALEAWMQSEEETDSETVPVGVLAKTRSKLKSKLRDASDENEQLRAEIERLKKGEHQPVSTALPPRPKLEDFDYDEDKYNEAIDDWQLHRFQATQNQTQSQQQAEQQQKAIMDKIENDSNAHYQRAEKLVESGVITAESYKAADNAVRQTLESVFPGGGDQTADAIISQLSSVGDGSEKVMYFLGKNPSELAKLKDKLSSDPSGLQAMIYLGGLQAKVTQAPSKKVSQAPKPAVKLQGDEQLGAVSSANKKKYQAAHKSGNTQLAFDIKRQARANGVDTSNW